MISLLDSPIEFILCHHEQGAAFMADLYGRMTGRPGVCLATLGPGATNLLTGVATANMDSSPVVAIAGQAATTRLHKESHQAMDIVSMFKPVTKWAASIRNEHNVAEIVRKAFKVAATERPGATLIELPEDIAKKEVDDEPIAPGQAVRRPMPDQLTIDAALSLIADAECPILLVGNGCAREHVTEHLTRFIDQTGIYAAMTFMAKGAVSDRHPRSLYTAGLGMRDHINAVFDEADLVIAVGYGMVEWHPSRWNPGGDKRILHIDFSTAEVDGDYRPAVECVGDIGECLCELNEQLTEKHRKDVPAHAKVREALTAELTESMADDEGFPMKPQRILHDLRLELDDNDILISDVGAHKMWVARHYPTYVPNTCIISNGFCSMAIAQPGSIGAQIVHRDRRVVGLQGDGGFLMNVQELATAAQYHLPVVQLIWEDSEYGLIRWKQMAEFHRTSHTTFVDPDFVKLAESFGAHAERVEAPAELRPALRRAFAHREGPSVIVVPVDYSENMKLTERLGEIIAR
jgi:acetolactate synthase-1/2/3 large subunit